MPVAIHPRPFIIALACNRIINRKYTYHLLRPGEEEDVYNLVLCVFHRFVAPTYSEDGIGIFLNMMSPDALKEKSPNTFTIVAEHNGQIVGIVAMINVSHIALLFVDSGFHGKGIGKNLIQEAINMCLKNNPDLEAITVSSSPNSLSFYKSVGFEIGAQEVNENGMRFIPMEKTNQLSTASTRTGFSSALQSQPFKLSGKKDKE